MISKRIYLLVAVSFVLAVTGCGGGGGSSSPAATAAILDTDGDGTGNNTDTDDDGDGVLDTADAFPLITLGGLTDTDGDGRPDVCDAACQAAGMTSVLNAYAYLDGPTTFSGYYIHKNKDSPLRLKSIEVDLDINDAESLFITQFRYSEDRYLGQVSSEIGLSLGSNISVNNDGEKTTYYIPQVSEVFHGTNQIILNTDNTINPFTDLGVIGPENFHANITLDFDSNYSDPDGHDNIKMSVYAQPKRSETDTGAVFLGSSNNDNGGYSYIYLKDKREWDDNASNLVAEASIFGVTRFAVSYFTSFFSQPVSDINQDQLGFRVKSNFVQRLANIRSEGIAALLYGARFADGRDADNNLVDNIFSSDPDSSNRFAVKYLHPEGSSNQRVFFKATLSDECKESQLSIRTCGVSDPRLYFFRPNKASMHGLVLGDYLGTPNVTNVEFLVKIDD